MGSQFHANYRVDPTCAYKHLTCLKPSAKHAPDVLDSHVELSCTNPRHHRTRLSSSISTRWRGHKRSEGLIARRSRAAALIWSPEPMMVLRETVVTGASPSGGATSSFRDQLPLPASPTLPTDQPDSNTTIGVSPRLHLPSP